MGRVAPGVCCLGKNGNDVECRQTDRSYSYRNGKDENEYDKVRKKYRASRQHPEYCPGSANHLTGGKKVDQNEKKVEYGAGRTTNEIKRQKSPAAPMALECRAQEVQADHVEEDVHQTNRAVQKLIRYHSPYLQSSGQGRRVDMAIATRKTLMFIIKSHLTTGVICGQLIRICGAWRYCDWNPSCV
jgi:hypothetical protein